MTTDSLPHKEAFGQRKRSFFEKAGGYLSASRLRHVFKGKREMTVLDIGCGYHAFLLKGLDSHLKAGVGVDRAVDESLDGGKYSFHRGEIDQVLPQLPGAGFDGILIINTLEHLWEPVKVLTECYRLLKPGGLLFVNVPSWFGKWFLEMQAYYLGGDTSGEVDDHKMYYNKRDLWPLLVKAGFRPSLIRLHYHKFGLSTYAVATRAV